MESARRDLRRLLLVPAALLLLIILIKNTPTTSPPHAPTSFLSSVNLDQSRKTRGGGGGNDPLTTASTQHPRYPPRDHFKDTPRHPLDPLTVAELNTVHDILSSHTLFTDKSYALHSVVLEEPPKESVLRWKNGDSVTPGRKASVVARMGGPESYVLTVELDTGRVIHRETVGADFGYPTMTIEDMTWSAVAPFESEEFNRTIVNRGVDPMDVACLPLSPGWYGETEEESKKRLIKVQCYSTKSTGNFYMRPIEGLTIILDMDTKRVLHISNRHKTSPLPSSTNTEYIYKAQQHMSQPMGLNPISIEQPKGPSFTVTDNHMVQWANWEFHLKPDPRAGVIVSRVRFEDPDSGVMRSVMYKGMTSELFVPYMDPTEAWYFKTYMDAGEYGFGLQAMPLDPLNDCPRNSYYMDGVFAAGDGSPYVRDGMICLFEKYAGDIGWRHSESPITGMGIREVRPKVTLVARMAASVANYDYIIDWEFQTDGLIRITVGLSGILMVKGTHYTHTNEVPESTDLYGTILSENIIGTIHDHYITFYLDMDVDGSDNSFVKVNLKRESNTDPNESPRKSYVKATREVAKTEKEAEVKLSLYDPHEFHVINPNKMTRVGNPVGYKIVPAGTAASLLDKEDPPQKRGGFTENQIWVTRYNRSEEWAGGLFVYQSRGDDTLAAWAQKDREIENKDIVLWYTLGFHHIPCQEDFPIMPTVSSSFDLKPVNFFERNPILYLPPNKEKDLPVCKATAASA